MDLQIIESSHRHISVSLNGSLNVDHRHIFISYDILTSYFSHPHLKFPLFRFKCIHRLSANLEHNNYLNSLATAPHIKAITAKEKKNVCTCRESRRHETEPVQRFPSPLILLSSLFLPVRPRLTGRPAVIIIHP